MVRFWSWFVFIGAFLRLGFSRRVSLWGFIWAVEIGRQGYGSKACKEIARGRESNENLKNSFKAFFDR